MQINTALTQPPVSFGSYELPKRIAYIEDSLKGLKHTVNLAHLHLPGSTLHILPGVGYGSTTSTTTTTPLKCPTVPSTSPRTTHNSSYFPESNNKKWSIGQTVMVLYEESKWSQATIFDYVKTGIKIQWLNTTTQVIATHNINIRIREMNENEKNNKTNEKNLNQSSSPCPAKNSLWNKCIPIPAPLVSEKDVHLVHTKEHIAKLERFCQIATDQDAAFFPFYSNENENRVDDPLNRKHADEDFYFSPGTMNAMRHAAGGAVAAVDVLFNNTETKGNIGIPSSFAIVRPPGHHCCGTTAAGFCLLNNTAVAAAHARDILGLERIVIVDWDYHHGDGTQKLFINDSSILTISVHAGMEFVDRDDIDNIDDDAIENNRNGDGIESFDRDDIADIADDATENNRNGDGTESFDRDDIADIEDMDDMDDDAIENNRNGDGIESPSSRNINEERYLEMVYPGTSDMCQGKYGKNQGKGYNINVPWPHTMVDGDDYTEFINTICVPAIEAFEPQLIIVACGFDAVQNDILAGTNLHARDYYDMTLSLKKLGIPMAVILEGGYAPPLIAQAAVNVVSALLGKEQVDRPEENNEEEENKDGNNSNESDGNLNEKEDGDWMEGMENEAPRDDTHENYIDASLVLNGIRRKLNKMEPWKSVLKKKGKGDGNKIFLETKNISVWSDQAVLKLNRLMREGLAEFE